MPDYIITAPDGRKFKVTGQGSREDAMSAVRKQLSGPSLSASAGKSANAGRSTASDIAVSGLGGLVSGAAQTLAFPETLARLTKKGIDYGVESLLPQGASDAYSRVVGSKADERTAATSMLPSTTDVANRVSQAMPTPQTTAGEYSRTVGEFVPAAVTLGGTGAALKYGVVPGLTSEAAGQMTEGTPYEPYARMGGAVGGALTAGGLSAAGRWAATPKDPAMQPIFDKAAKLKSDADRLYAVVDQSGIQVDPLSLQAGIARVKAKLGQMGLEPGLAPTETERALKILDNLGTQPATFRRLDAARQAIKEAFSFNKPSEVRLATIMTREFDEFIKSLGPQDMISATDPAATAQALTQARSLWSRSAAMNDKATIIDNIWQGALDAVGANYSKAGLMTALRQKFRSLNAQIRRDADVARLFSPVERETINNIVRGTTTENIYRAIGKLAPVSPSAAAITNASLTPLTAGAGFMAGGPVGMAVGASIPPAIGVGVGLPARTGANMLQRREIDRLVAMLLNEGKPATIPLPSRLTPPMVGYYASALESKSPR